jgi:hypothetical protein
MRTHAGVDSHQPTFQIKQRTAGIPADEHAVGLIGRPGGAHQPPKAQHQTPLFVKSAGMPQRKHPVAEARAIRLLDFDEWILS